MKTQTIIKHSRTEFFNSFNCIYYGFFSTIKKPCKYYQTNNLVETAIEYFMATFACYLECEATQAQLQVKVIKCFSSKIVPNKIIEI